jgi:hypothetical protein
VPHPQARDKRHNPRFGTSIQIRNYTINTPHMSDEPDNITSLYTEEVDRGMLAFEKK